MGSEMSDSALKAGRERSRRSAATTFEKAAFILSPSNNPHDSVALFDSFVSTLEYPRRDTLSRLHLLHSWKQKPSAHQPLNFCSTVSWATTRYSFYITRISSNVIRYTSPFGVNKNSALKSLHTPLIGKS